MHSAEQFSATEELEENHQLRTRNYELRIMKSYILQEQTL